MEQTETIITRIGFCPVCAELERMKAYGKLDQEEFGDQFLVYGSTGWHFREAKRNSPYWGFTPHIYQGKTFENNVIVKINCAVYGCGSIIGKGADGKHYLVIDPKKTIRSIFTIQQWNALVLYKDWQYRV